VLSAYFSQCVRVCLLCLCLFVCPSSSAWAGQTVGKPTHRAQAPKETAAAPLMRGLRATFWGRLFAGYHISMLGEQDFQEFVMRELQLAVMVDWKDQVGVVARMEVLRSAQPQSLFGIDGDAYVVRLLQAWAFGRLTFGVFEGELRLGLIKDPWIDLLEVGYVLRDLEPMQSQQGEFFFPSDLGASALLRLWGGMVEFRYTLTNGEGTNRAEQNSGKNTTLTLSLRAPSFRLLGRKAVIGLHGLYRDGSQGAARIANHRVAAALTFGMRGYSAGVEFVNATGYRGDGDISADGLSAWLSADVWLDKIGVLARFDRLNSNQSVDNAVQQTITAGLYVNALEPLLGAMFRRFRLYLYYQNITQEENSAPLPGVPAAVSGHRVMLQLAIRTHLSLSR